jgi:DNA-binding transcriptional LysR family regulator
MNLLTLFDTFVRIAETGSISNAARALRLSVPMASRHLRSLEKSYGLALVRRTTRRLSLTEEGKALLPHARRVLREVAETHDLLRRDRRASGLVVMSAPVSFGLHHLTPSLPQLLQANPGLELDLRLDDRVVDLISEGVDLVLRVGAQPPDSPFIVARRLAHYERVLCATPDFVKRHAPLDDVERLSAVGCLVLGQAVTSWQFETGEGPRSVAVNGRLRANNVLALLDAARAGLGVAQMPLWLVRDDLARRRLVRVYPHVMLPPVGVHGMVHVDARRSNALRIILDFLASSLPASLGDAPSTVSRA